MAMGIQHDAVLYDQVEEQRDALNKIIAAVDDENIASRYFYLEGK